MFMARKYLTADFFSFKAEVYICVCLYSFKIAINFDCPFPDNQPCLLTPDSEELLKTSGKDVQTHTLMWLWHLRLQARWGLFPFSKCSLWSVSWNAQRFVRHSCIANNFDEGPTSDSWSSIVAAIGQRGYPRESQN